MDHPTLCSTSWAGGLQLSVPGSHLHKDTLLEGCHEKERAWHSVGVMFFSCKGKVRRGAFHPSLVRHGMGTQVRRCQWRERAEETGNMDKTPPSHKRFTVSGQVNYRWGTCNSQQGTCSPHLLPYTEARVGKTLIQNQVLKSGY